MGASEPDLTEGPLSSNTTFGASPVSASWHQGAARLHVAVLLGQQAPSWGTQFVPWKWPGDTRTV